VRLRVRGRALRVLRIGGVSVVVGARPVERPSASIEALRAQHDVAISLARRTAFLPARFGSVVGQGELEQTVRRRAASIRRALARVEGRAQMTIRVVPRRREPERSRDESMPGTAYLEGRRREARSTRRDAAAIRRGLRAFVRAERAQPGGAGVRLTLFHLVNVEDVAAYRRAAAELEPMVAGALAVTGPWPPFAFAPELR
jgi:hypothetical protein